MTALSSLLAALKRRYAIEPVRTFSSNDSAVVVPSTARARSKRRHRSQASG